MSRETSTGAFIPEIDGLRFFAIAAVILFHVNRSLTTHSAYPANPSLADEAVSLVALQGYLGVQLFFVISGFILALPFAQHYLQGKSKPTLKRYFLRRVTRLEPPYIINLVVWVFLLFALSHLGARSLKPITELSFLSNFIASVFYLHNAIFGVPSKINGVAWSLEIEVQFYILAPLLALLFRIASPSLRRAVLMLAPLAASVVAEFVMPPPYKHLHGLNVLYQLQYFLMGLLLADLYLTDWKVPESHPWRADLLAGCAWLAMIPATASHFHTDLILPWLILVAYCGAFRGVIGNWIVRLTPLVIVGGMCYTIYLYHWVIISTVARFVERFPLSQSYAPRYLAYLALNFILIVGITSLFFVLFEKPFMRKDWPARTAQWFREKFAAPQPSAPLPETPPEAS